VDKQAIHRIVLYIYLIFSFGSLIMPNACSFTMINHSSNTTFENPLPFIGAYNISKGFSITCPVFPQLSIDLHNRGFLCWLDAANSSSQNKSLHLITSMGNLTTISGWKEWNSVYNLSSVNQTRLKGFIVGDANENGEYFVLFSNLTSISTGELENTEIMLWNGTNLASIYNMTSNWTESSEENSIWLRAPCGKIRFDGNNGRHLAWNNGTHLFYKYNDSMVQIVDNATTLSEFSMILNSTGQLYFVYSKASSNLAKDKQLYYCYKNASMQFSSPVELFASNNLEDSRLDATFDTRDNLLVTWTSSRNESFPETYKIQYLNTTENVVRTISGSGIANESKVVYFMGRLNIFYWESQLLNSSNHGNIVWRTYTNVTDMNDSVMRILSPPPWNSYLDSFMNVGTDHDDDMYIVSTYMLDNVSRERFIQLIKIDYYVPSAAYTNPVALNNEDFYYMEFPGYDNVSFAFVINEEDVRVDAWWNGDSDIILQNISSTQWILSVPRNVLLRYGGPCTLCLFISDECGNSLHIFRSVEFYNEHLYTEFYVFLILGIVGVSILITLIFILRQSTKKKKLL